MIAGESNPHGLPPLVQDSFSRVRPCGDQLRSLSLEASDGPSKFVGRLVSSTGAVVRDFKERFLAVYPPAPR